MSLSTSSRSVPTLVAGAHDVTSQGAVAARRKAFRALHERGCFVIPNPWDVDWPASCRTPRSMASLRRMLLRSKLWTISAVGPRVSISTTSATSPTRTSDTAGR